MEAPSEPKINFIVTDFSSRLMRETLISTLNNSPEAASISFKEIEHCIDTEVYPVLKAQTGGWYEPPGLERPGVLSLNVDLKTQNRAALHEIGHALGLPHLNLPAMMHPQVPHDELQARDISALQRLIESGVLGKSPEDNNQIFESNDLFDDNRFDPSSNDSDILVQ